MKMAHVTTRANSPHGLAIRAATRGWGNHSLIAFRHDDGALEYFESHWKKDKSTGVTGVRCCDWQNLEDWLSEKDSRQMKIVWMPYHGLQVQLAYRFCVESVGTIRYAHIQLWHNLVRWYPRAGSSMAMTCSEFAARVHHAADPTDAYKFILKSGYRTWDMLPPAGRDGLMEAVDQIAHKFN